MTVYVDESGNGGLFDKEQPVFALSAVAIEEDEARRLREKYLPESLVGTEELKHDSLAKRLRNNVQKRLGDLQEELLRDHLAFSYVIVKRYFVIAKMMMDCRAGEDPRAWDYQNDARRLYYHYDEICGKCDFEGMLKSYVAAVGLIADDEKFPSAFSGFINAARVAISQWPPLYYYLGGIASGNKACVEEFLANTGKYMHAPMLIGLVNVLFSEDQRDIDVICDDSPQFESVEDVFKNSPLSGHVRSIRKGESDDYYGIQLADLLSGGARYVGERQQLGLERGRKEKPYVDRLEAAYAKYNRLLWQPADDSVSIDERIKEIAKWTNKSHLAKADDSGVL